MRGYGEALPAETASSVRVMTWNTAGDATGAYRIAQSAVAMNADIVALPETAQSVGEDVAIEMRELGRPMWVHHVQYNKEIERGPQSWVTTILISPDLGDYAVIDSSDDGSSNTAILPSAVVMPVDGTGSRICAGSPISAPKTSTSSSRATSTPRSITWRRSRPDPATSATATTRHRAPATARSARGRRMCPPCCRRRSIT
jgi:hypothetical protein